MYRFGSFTVVRFPHRWCSIRKAIGATVATRSDFDRRNHGAHTMATHTARRSIRKALANPGTREKTRDALLAMIQNDPQRGRSGKLHRALVSGSGPRHRDVLLVDRMLDELTGQGGFLMQREARCSYRPGLTSK